MNCTVSYGMIIYFIIIYMIRRTYTYTYTYVRYFKII